MEFIIVGDFSFSNMRLTKENHKLLDYDETKENVDDAGERLMEEHGYNTYMAFNKFNSGQQKEILDIHGIKY